MRCSISSRLPLLALLIPALLIPGSAAADIGDNNVGLNTHLPGDDFLDMADEISAAVVYLASPASAMVTGTSLKVDGGWTAA